MTTASLIGVLNGIVKLLRQCGYVDKAVWMDSRRLVIASSESSPEARERAMNELHGVVLGMGGLLDLSLHPTPESRYSSSSARKQLDALADALYDLTR